MSIFESTELACPACGAINAFEAVNSVNADRRADLRRAILDGSFQRQPGSLDSSRRRTTSSSSSAPTRRPRRCNASG